MSSEKAQFFEVFGSELCRMWDALHQTPSRNHAIPPRELETAGILQGLRTPAMQSFELDSRLLSQQQNVDNAPNVLEPSLLQPQDWLGQYDGIGNWLLIDWDQGLG